MVLASAYRGLALVLMLLAGVGAASEPKKGKTRVSANGLYGIRLVELSEKRCRLEVVREQEVAWSLDKCVGVADDLYFVSNDGQRFWVLYPLPEKPRTSPTSHRNKRPAVLDVVVAIQYDRKGTVLETKRLSDFMSEKSVEEVRELGRHFKWLGGMLSVPGKPPRLNDASEVEFETVASHTFKLKF